MAPSTADSLGCLLRVYWMMLGNLLAAITVYNIVHSKDDLSVVDAVYWLFILSLIAARYVEIRFLQGRTSEGKPASARDWRRYSLGILAISATVWVIAHGLSYYLR